MQVARDDLGGAGTQDAGLAFGGDDGGLVACTDEYDGSAWSTGGAMQVARKSNAGAGTNTSALSFGGKHGGFPSSKGRTEGKRGGRGWVF